MAENNLIENGRLIYAKGHTIPGRTGLNTGRAAGDILGAIRNVGPGELVIAGVDQYVETITPASALGALAFGFFKVSGFTALASTGARGAEPVPERKRNPDHRILRPSFVASESREGDLFAQVEVADTAALTGSTISPAPIITDPIGVLAPDRIAPTATSLIFWGASRWTPAAQVPLSLAPDEGLIFVALEAYPASLVVRYGFSVDAHVP